MMNVDLDVDLAVHIFRYADLFKDRKGHIV